MGADSKKRIRSQESTGMNSSISSLTSHSYTPTLARDVVTAPKGITNESKNSKGSRVVLKQGLKGSADSSRSYHSNLSRNSKASSKERRALSKFSKTIPNSTNSTTNRKNKSRSRNKKPPKMETYETDLNYERIKRGYDKGDDQSLQVIYERSYSGINGGSPRLKSEKYKDNTSGNLEGDTSNCQQEPIINQSQCSKINNHKDDIYRQTNFNISSKGRIDHEEKKGQDEQLIKQLSSRSLNSTSNTKSLTLTQTNSERSSMVKNALSMRTITSSSERSRPPFDFVTVDKKVNRKKRNSIGSIPLIIPSLSSVKNAVLCCVQPQLLSLDNRKVTANESTKDDDISHAPLYSFASEESDDLVFQSSI